MESKETPPDSTSKTNRKSRSPNQIAIIAFVITIVLVSCTSNNQSKFLLKFLDYIPDNEIYRPYPREAPSLVKALGANF